MPNLTTLLSDLGLTELGRCPYQDDRTLALIGPDEPGFWEIFSGSPEHKDGQPDAMDRWSRRVLTDVADTVGAEALFPFGGPPFQPFFTWALQTGRFWTSPIQFLVHDTRGLFASFRGALVLPEPCAPPPALNKPCDTCTDKPCLSGCPVDAMGKVYDVDRCKSHLRSPAGEDCMSSGCKARRACPIGQGLRQPAQASHHMKAFL